jgi:hypothetical protein
LLVNNKCGISGKDEHSIRVFVDRSTIISTFEYALGILNKTGSMSPTNVEVRVTNSILRALNPQTNAVFTSYSPADIHLYYSALDQAWPGAINCVTNDPRWRDELNHDYYLLPGSPCIDAGDPQDPPDPDGSPPDLGYFTFIPAPPVLREPAKLPAGGLEFMVDSYTNRNYQVEISTNAQSWWPMRTFFQTNGSYRFQDLEPTDDQQRFYRVVIEIP